MIRLTMTTIVSLVVCVAVAVAIAIVAVAVAVADDVVLLSYRVQFLLGDKTLSPNSFPSSYAIASLAADLELEPYSSIVDNVELHRALE